MLRVLKEKAKGVSGDSHVAYSRQEADRFGSGISTYERERRDHTPIVSHIPISIGSNSNALGPDSSLSSRSEEEDDSNEINDTDAKYRRDTNSQHRVRQDSYNESSGAIDNTPRTVPPSCFKDTSRPLTRCRKVSIEDTDIPQAPAAKKARLDSEESEARRVGSHPITPSPAQLTLLALEEDDSMLSSLHAFVRKQIEVFTATSVELKQPAPGRKQPIKLHQVGLRCIHCKNNTNGRRVKRAVCYPSNVGRVYHSVSDMKFDHFNNCRSLPADVKAMFQSLKVEGAKKGDKTNRRGTSSSTAQYYEDSAIRMGMYDGPGGIFIACTPGTAPQRGLLPSLLPNNLSGGSLSAKGVGCSFPGLAGSQEANVQICSPLATTTILNPPSLVNVLNKPVVSARPEPGYFPALSVTNNNSNNAKITLQEDSDQDHLNAIHCFVRKHVEVFAANEDDTAAPAPGRKTRVVLGQVGIRCIHCAKLSPKHRVKRSICYPPAVSGIYHAVSNMKFDHFALCRGLPEKAREEFSALRDSCSRRGNPAGNSSNSIRGGTSSTAKYYQQSALRKGLIDTDSGIRFSQKEADTKPSVSSQRTPIPTGMSALVKAACQAA